MMVRMRSPVVEAVLFDGNLVGEPEWDSRSGQTTVRPRTCPEWFPAISLQVPNAVTGETEVPVGEVWSTERGLLIGALGGTRSVRPGDWIIRDIFGDLLPCAANVFQNVYEPAMGETEAL